MVIGYKEEAPNVTYFGLIDLITTILSPVN